MIRKIIEWFQSEKALMQQYARARAAQRRANRRLRTGKGPTYSDFSR